MTARGGSQNENLVVYAFKRSACEFVSANAYENLGSMGTSVYPVLSPLFTTLVNQTRQIYMMQIEMSQLQSLNTYLASLAGKVNFSRSELHLQILGKLSPVV